MLGSDRRRQLEWELCQLHPWRRGPSPLYRRRRTADPHRGGQARVPAPASGLLALRIGLTCRLKLPHSKGPNIGSRCRSLRGVVIGVGPHHVRFTPESGHELTQVRFGVVAPATLQYSPRSVAPRWGYAGCDLFLIIENWL